MMKLDFNTQVKIINNTPAKDRAKLTRAFEGEIPTGIFGVVQRFFEWVSGQHTEARFLNAASNFFENKVINKKKEVNSLNDDVFVKLNVLGNKVNVRTSAHLQELRLSTFEEARKFFKIEDNFIKRVSQ